eukprot:CAMPEP_0168393132 /NCGR_PEP_ID=MMETSP0228-20121227/18858_1 /TAXON_ID=133427 /ORGANISM="Protoceratium reticulatum, Strain CCCM 535 (=CCMP 1889)" /LENGTH=58 /DNA_ID=CAMNT_0008406499 /DNA_START=54 /DNA_END=227 /DNA_ORIENTATION=-
MAIMQARRSAPLLSVFLLCATVWLLASFGSGYADGPAFVAAAAGCGRSLGRTAARGFK